MSKNTFSVGFVLLVFIPVIHAQLLIFEASPQTTHSNSFIDTTGSFGSVEHRLTRPTISAQLDLHNDQSSQVTFRRVSVDFQSQSLSFSNNFLVNVGGFGGTLVTNTIMGTIEFDATLQFLDNQPVLTTPHLEDLFAIAFNYNVGRSEQTRISGTYEFSGPTQTIEGNFSYSPFWVRQSDSHNLPILDTTDFPNGVSISGAAYWEMGDVLNLVDETIDGVDLDVSLGATRLFIPPRFRFTFVPEPSEYALAMGFMMMIFAMLRQRRFLKSI